MSPTTLGENAQSSTTMHSPVNHTVMSMTSSFNKQILLSTAIIHVKYARGEFVPLTVLLDSGS